MMRVLGKYDLENAILFDDLKTLLENYGVPVERQAPRQDLEQSADAAAAPPSKEQEDQDAAKQESD